METYIIIIAIAAVIAILATLFVLAFGGLAVWLSKSVTRAAVESAKPTIIINSGQDSRIAEQILEIARNLSASVIPKLFESEKERRSDEKKELE